MQLATKVHFTQQPLRRFELTNSLLKQVFCLWKPFSAFYIPFCFDFDSTPLKLNDFFSFKNAAFVSIFSFKKSSKFVKTLLSLHYVEFWSGLKEYFFNVAVEWLTKWSFTSKKNATDYYKLLTHHCHLCPSVVITRF